MKYVFDLIQLDQVRYIDPSEHLRPEAQFAAKPVGSFRDYSIDTNDPIKERVRKTYLEMHTNQTLQFVQGRIAHWTQFDKFKVSHSLVTLVFFIILDMGKAEKLKLGFRTYQNNQCTKALYIFESGN